MDWLCYILTCWKTKTSTALQYGVQCFAMWRLFGAGSAALSFWDYCPDGLFREVVALRNAADGILWWRRRGCGDGWNYMVVTHKMVVQWLLVPPMAKTLAAQGFLEMMQWNKSGSKVVQKTGFLRWQNMDKKHRFFRTKCVSKPC